MSKTFLLEAQIRTVTGHAVKQLRNSGSTPASLYGKGTDNITIVIPTEKFIDIWEEAGETQLVDLMIDGKKHPVLIHTVQKHPYQDKILHVEFLQVNLKEKLKTYVPIEIIGEAPAATSGLGTLLTLVNELEVEALPTNIPESIQVDVSNLTDVDMEIKVADLKIPADVTLLTDTEIGVVKIGALSKEEEPTPAVTEGEAAAVTPAEGEATAEPPEESSDSSDETK